MMEEAYVTNLLLDGWLILQGWGWIRAQLLITATGMLGTQVK